MCDVARQQDQLHLAYEEAEFESGGAGRKTGCAVQQARATALNLNQSGLPGGAPGELMDSDFPDQAKAGSDSSPSDAMAALLSSKSASRTRAPSPLARSLIRNEAATRPAPGLEAGQSPASSTQQLAAKAEPWLAASLGNRWESYRKRLDECREAPSEESVHELRVAIRRLISQIIMLHCVLPGGKCQRTLRMLKGQLKALGRLRDHHIQQVFLEQRAARFPELSVLRSYLRRREGKLVKTASRQIRRFRARRLGKWIRSIREDLDQHSRDPRRRKQLAAVAVRRAGEAFAETVARRRAIDFSDLSTIHHTRVAFKKFRYLVESMPLGVTGLSKRDLRALGWYQRRMGIIQDLEVIQATITDLIQRQDGLEALLAPFSADLRRRRARALRLFRKSADALFQFWPARTAASRNAPPPVTIGAL